MSLRTYRMGPTLTWVSSVVWFTGFHVAIPVGLSFVARHHGWDGHRPGVLNLLGLAPLAAGAAIVIWALARHAPADRGWGGRLDRGHIGTPDYLVIDGPYRLTRNPIYVGGYLEGAGWAILLGSIPIALLLAVTVVGIPIAVRFEERGLAKRFGDQWAAYAEATPRFVRLRPRSARSGRQ